MPICIAVLEEIPCHLIKCLGPFEVFHNEEIFGKSNLPTLGCCVKLDLQP